MDSIAVDSIAMDSIAMDSIAMDSIAMDSIAMDSWLPFPKSPGQGVGLARDGGIGDREPYFPSFLLYLP